MKNYAFQVFYLGRNYQGFQRQPNGQTIENHLEYAFIMADLIYSFSKNHYKSCSRTDQGVNALANVFTLRCSNDPVLSQINAFLPTDIVIWSLTEVGDDFNPRTKVIKQYRYYLNKDMIPSSSDITRIFDFKGRSDFTAFLRKHGAGMEYSISNIEKINVQERSEYHIIDIYGDRFGREQIRRMIGFLLQEKFSNNSPTKFLDHDEQIDIYSAPPTLLVLVSIRYNPEITWFVDRKLYQQLKDQFNSVLQQVKSTKIIENVIEDFQDLLQSTNMS